MTTLHPPTHKAWDDWTSPFGETEGRSRPHSGIDWGWGAGYELLAPLDGTVTAVDYTAGYNGGQGGIIDISNGRVRIRIMHLNANSDVGLRVGGTVTRGQLIGYMGQPTTGDSKFPHCHMGMWIDGVLVDPTPYFTQDLPIGDGAPVVGPGVVVDGRWDGITTLYTGTYGEQNDSDYYVIAVGETIWDAVTSRGLTLEQVQVWTSAVAASKWAGSILGRNPGSSFWDGSGTYYAGCTIALRDLVAKYSAAEAAAAAKTAAAQVQVAELEARTAAAAAAQAQAEAEADTDKTTAKEAAAAAATAVVAAEQVAAAKEKLEQAQAAAAARSAALATAVEQAKAETIPAVVANTQIALYESSEELNAEAPLAGLLADDPKKRKKWYLRYAVAALIVSFVPDIVTVLTVIALATGVEMDTAILLVTAGANLASSTLLKLGTAFGFVAASNTLAPASAKEATR